MYLKKNSSIFKIIFFVFLPVVFSAIVIYIIIRALMNNPESDIATLNNLIGENNNSTLFCDTVQNYMIKYDSEAKNYTYKKINTDRLPFLSRNPEEMFSQYLSFCRNIKTDFDILTNKSEMGAELYKMRDFRLKYKTDPELANKILDKIWNEYAQLHGERDVDPFLLKADTIEKHRRSFDKDNLSKLDQYYYYLIDDAYIHAVIYINKISYSKDILKKSCNTHEYLIAKDIINVFDHYIHDITIKFKRNRKIVLSYDDYAYFRIFFPRLYDIYRTKIYSYAKSEYENLIKRINDYCDNIS